MRKNKKIIFIVLGIIALTAIFLIFSLFFRKSAADNQAADDLSGQEAADSNNNADGQEKEDLAGEDEANLEAADPANAAANSENSTAPAPAQATGPVVYNPDLANSVSGTVCAVQENRFRRPIAVMLAADKNARPLYGTSQADMVFEMPVITNMIPRLMAIFVCNSPAEIGSIRSARHDYLTLAKGMDAMLAHWGGSHFALDMLKNKDTVPDLDALKNEGGAFFRKAGLVAPHNGFASYSKLMSTAQSLGYRTTNNFSANKFRSESALENRGANGHLTVGFPGVYRVTYDYDRASNTYLRSWGGKEDIDGGTGWRVAPKNVVVIRAVSRQIEGQYNDVDIEGEGEMFAYMEGREFGGKWVKEKGDCVIGDELVCVNDKPMRFIKANGQELEFVPGQIWVEVLEPGQVLRWEPGV